ncbi:hypothetical protein FHL15_004106 [Xylaria flabelliformis]|uniref:Glutathione S-transferase UstS-like C-terminal domain-containing protein n=1 Tax=Xylaria flabelliformis TaxID=2512241 RepID=A0A553I4A5_9PEZI|nr:hypothetical protein FHL15_004106 [Xylaria flabelliformis]
MVTKYVEESNTQKSSPGFNLSKNFFTFDLERGFSKRSSSAYTSKHASSFPDKDEFTVPTIKLPDGTYIMDSLEIAHELEKRHPEPSLHLNEDERKRYVGFLSKAFESLRPVYILGVPNKLLNPVNHDYWHKTREPYVGMPLEKFVRENEGPQVWEGAAPHLANITAMLKENDKGPFFLGDTVSYLDFTHAGFLIMFRALGDDVWKPLLEATGDAELHLKFLEALKPWTARDD